MEYIEGTLISSMCDYSFGDQASIICNIDGGFMKEANVDNIDFFKIVDSIDGIITLFIDNIRLYNRKIILSNAVDQKWINSLMDRNDLLNLCSLFPKKKFIIFTGLEDTPIDDYIKVPSNVHVYAVNAIYNNDRVHPFPYGLQRKLNRDDNRIDIIKNIDKNITPSKLLYVNHSNTNSSRVGINDIFRHNSWSSVNECRVDYKTFLNDILHHKFVICPIGNAIDCHRNWETLYLKRVPVMLRNDYLEKLFVDFPVLFVDEYEDVDEELLNNNNHLYEEALVMDMNRLDRKYLFNEIIKKHDTM